MNNIISGYTSIFKQHISDEYKFSSTIYIASDIDKRELFLVLLTPESYMDAYKIIKNVSIQNIVVFIPTLKATFLTNCSESNLLQNIRYIKPSTKLIYPIKLSPETYTVIYNGFIKSDFCQNKINPNISAEYIPSGNSDWYDILIRDGETSKYFCQYLTEEKMLSLYNNDNIDQIHVAYNSTNCGGINYLEAIALNKNYAKKLYAHSFITDTDFTEAKDNKVNIGPYVSRILMV